jgi:hypothetical protein
MSGYSFLKGNGQFLPNGYIPACKYLQLSMFTPPYPAPLKRDDFLDLFMTVTESGFSYLFIRRDSDKLVLVLIGTILFFKCFQYLGVNDKETLKKIIRNYYVPMWRKVYLFVNLSR